MAIAWGKYILILQCEIKTGRIVKMFKILKSLQFVLYDLQLKKNLLSFHDRK